MATNILIGIGGTGAKVVESALFLMAAGFGPSGPVHVGLIDQDSTNGNMTRTDSLLQLMIGLRRMLDGGSNRLARQGEGACPLFGIELHNLFGQAASANWRPASTAQPTLAQILDRTNMSDAERTLFDLLFRPAGVAEVDKEQDLPLSKGYRGRAHVGSAAMFSAMLQGGASGTDLLKRLKELLVKGSQGNGEVRVMLAGSLFGGTGASGFPTLARTLHAMRNEDENGINAAQVKIGGMLMLPYFGFSPPEDAGVNAIRTEQLLPQARVAVDHYGQLMGEEGVFDRLYLAGFDRTIMLDYFHEGATEQCNPALFPELIAALGVNDFFKADAIAPDGNSKRLAVRTDGEEVGWGDLPVDDAHEKILLDRLARMLRMAVYWRHEVEPWFDEWETSMFGKKRLKAEWLRKHCQDVDWDVGTPDLRSGLTDFWERMLTWAATIERYAQPPVTLWDTQDQVRDFRSNDPGNPIELHPPRGSGLYEAMLQGIMVPPAQIEMRKRSLVLGDLSNEMKGDSKGIGRVISAVYSAVRPY